jgi:limonene-1,2-epoxide hydrolase
MSELMSAIERLQEANKRRDKQAVLALVTADVEYQYHVGSKPLLGVERVARFLDRYWEITADLEWRIDRWARNGNKLLVEGYEEYTDTRTGARVAHPYMGIFEFRDGLIARWRDYFEMDSPAPESVNAR